MSLSTISQTALSGIVASETMLGVAANNLANLETPGFKQSQVLLTTRPTAGPPGAQVGSGVQVSGVAPDTSQGALLPGNGPLNLAISGDGYFVLQGSDGQHFYTRDGTFHANADGQLVSQSGHRVLGWQGGAGASGDPGVFQGDLNPLFVLNQRADSQNGDPRYLVGSDGVIRHQLADGTSRSVGQIRLARFNNPAGLRAGHGNLYQATASSGPAQIGNPGTRGLGRLSPHTYEASNSDIAHNIISMSRAELLFRANLKVLSVADSMADELMDLFRR